MELFKLLGTIAIDNAAAEKAIDSVGRKASGLGSNLESMGTKISGWGGTLTKTVTATGAALGAVAGKTAIDFEDSTANINTLLDDESHLKGYENAIMQFSNATGINLKTVSDGMYQTISSIGDGGKETEKMFQIMGRSAKAGGAEVSDSVALISAGMKGYNQINAETAQKISDLGFQTAKLGVTTFPELATSMQPLFPLSSSLGLSYEELFGVMATGTGVTGNTAEVTTQFKSVLSNLMKPTDAMARLMEKYGYSNAQAMIESQGLTGVLKILKDETGGQSDKMAELFSSTEALTIMTALTGSQFDTFKDKLGSMREATGATDTAYEKMNTNGDKLRVTFNLLKNTLTDLGGAILETLAPVIESMGSKVQEFCAWFGSLDDGTKRMIVSITAFAVAAGPVLTIIGKIVTGVGGLMKIGGGLLTGFGKIAGAVSGTLLPAASGIAAFVSGTVIPVIGSAVTFITGTLIPGIAAIVGPILPIAAAITGVIAVGVLLIKHWDQVKDVAGKVWEGIKSVVSKTVEAVKGFINNLRDKVSDAWNNIRDKAADVWGNIKDKVTGLAKDTAQKTIEYQENVKQKLADAWSVIKEKASEIWEGIKDKVAGLAKDLAENVINHVKSLKDQTVKLWGGIKDKAVDIWGTTKEKVGSFASDMAESVGGKMASLKEKTVSAFESIREKSGGVWKTMGDTIRNTFDAARDKVRDVVEKIKDFFNFDWRLPDIKLPHFNIDGEFSLDPPSIPHFSVDWYAKGAVLNQPVAFGVNPASGKLMAGGEAGPEAVAPIDVLQDYVRQAVQDENAALKGLLERIIALLEMFFPQALSGMERSVVLDTGELVGAMAYPMSNALGKIVNKRRRGS